MVANAYETILIELSNTLKVPALKPDPNNTCLIRLQNGCEINIEMDKNNEALIIGSNIGQISPGGYRTNIFREALKANALPGPKRGIFAWSRKADQLVIFAMLPMKNLTGSKVADFLVPFAAQALKWQEAIQSGRVPVVETRAQQTSARGGGLFGLKP